MNRNQFTLLLFLVVVVGVAGLVVYKRQNEGRREGDPSIGKKLLGDFPVNDVASIAIKHGTNELNLVKKDNLWVVRERNDYPAGYSEISDFLLKARDLKIVQNEKVGASQLARLGLAQGQGTNAALVVEFKDQAGKPLKSLLLGKTHTHKSNRPSPMGEEMGEGGWPDGRYVKVGANSDDVAVISDALSNIEPRPEQWLNKDFIKVDMVRSISVTYPVATNSWKVTRDTDSADWKLAEAKPSEQLDSSKTSGLSNPLSSPTFNDVQPAGQAAQAGLDKPTLVTLDTFDNFSYALKVGQKTNDTYPLMVSVTAQLPKERTPGKDEKPEDKTRLDKEFKDSQKKLEDKLAQEQVYQNWIYLVSSWTLEPLLKERSQLLQEKKDDKASSTNAPPSTLVSPPVTPAAPKAADDPASLEIPK